ncbi:MAG: serine/threonine protein kinase [Deltaproteobacteria bacterium]|nr:serine/threonine protein kinase [Deltaproteobacteria bacterium]
MTQDQQPVIVCRLLDVQEMRGIAEAALEESIALLSLNTPPPDGEFVIELHAPGSRPVLLSAQVSGEPSDGMCPIRLRPFDDEHYGQLLAFVCGTESAATQPVTRWSQDIPKLSSVPRLDTIPDMPTDFRAELAERPSGPGMDPLIGRQLAGGKYLIESLLGEGSAGAVYRCRHLALDKQLAVKVLHPRFRADATFSKRFHHEARAASRLDHPNVARVQDFGEEDDGLLYIVMELLQGNDLRRLLHLGSLPRQRRIDILMSVLSALAAANDQGIVHRDIKPENVVVIAAQNDDGDTVDLVKVCDFGLATVKPRQTGGTDVRSAASAMSWVAGTPEYMSPEQILGETLDIRSDLYACGVILFEMLAGRLPFESQSVLNTLKRQLYEDPPSLRSIDPSIDPRLDALTRRALSKQRDGRPATPRDFRNELRAALQMKRNVTTSGPLPRSGVSEHFSTGSVRPSPMPVSMSQPPAAVAQAREALRAHLAAAPEQTADRIMRDVSGVISELSGKMTAEQFTARLRDLPPAIPILLDRGAVTPLAALAMLLVRIANHTTPEAHVPREICAKALVGLRDESRLVRVAEVLLAGAPKEKDACRELLMLGGQAAIGALLEARRRLIGREVNRQAFIAALRSFGAASQEPLVRALTTATQQADGGDPFLVEDLLRAMPDEPNPEMLQLGQMLAHHGSGIIRRTVISRLPEVVGPSARAVLRVATRDPEEPVRVAAIASLRRIGAVDAAVVALARDLLTTDVEASVELRSGVAGALQDVLPQHRGEAFELLKEALRPRTRSIMTVLRKTVSSLDDPTVIETIARSLIALSREEGRREVQRRIAVSKGELKDRLERLLR